MEKPIGITFEVGKSDRGWFWYLGKLKLLQVRPSHYRKYNAYGPWVPAKYGGVKIDLMVGKLRRPIPRFYKFWRFLKVFNKDYVKRESEFNPWNSGNHWFVYTFPVEIGLFLSVSYGKNEKQPGFYIGCKTYEVNRISQNRKIYMPDGRDIIRNDVAWGEESEKGNVYMCPSASIRVDLVD